MCAFPGEGLEIAVGMHIEVQRGADIAPAHPLRARRGE
jgi:hypothetical protein